MTNNPENQLTLEDIKSISTFARIISIKPLQVEFDMTQCVTTSKEGIIVQSHQDCTEIEIQKRKALIDKLLYSINNVSDYNTEVINIGAFGSTPDEFIDFFSQFLPGTAISMTNLPSFAPSTKELQYAFTTMPNNKAYLVPNISSVNFSVDSDGNITTKDETSEPIDSDQDLILARQFASAVLRAKLDTGDNSVSRVTVDLFELAEGLNIDLKNARTSDEVNERMHALIDKIRKLREMQGVWERSKIISFIDFTIDLKSKTITFTSQYTEDVIRAASTPKVKQVKNVEVLEVPKEPKHKPYTQWTSDLIDASIHSASNKVCVALVYYICCQVKQRGNVPDSKIKGNENLYIEDPEGRYKEISIRELINHVSEFYIAYNKETEGKRKTQIIRRAIYGKSYDNKSGDEPLLITYLRKYTYLFDAYKEMTVTVPPVPPSYKDIDNLIEIVHHGESRKYKKNTTHKFKSQDTN